MRYLDFSNKIETIVNDQGSITWTKFLMESMVSVVLGLGIGFMATSIVSTSIILSILVIPLFIYGIVLIIYKHKISILDMLDNELKNRHYENVIILGLQISNTLFNTKQNENRVRIGRKVEEAIKTCDRELGEIIIDGKKLTREYISVKLNIDDLGWSVYQANKRNWVEAVDTIKKGILSAEKISTTLFKENQDNKESQEYLQMSLKGYRHLAGIYFDKDICKVQEAILNEKIIKLIVSLGQIITKPHELKFDDYSQHENSFKNTDKINGYKILDYLKGTENVSTIDNDQISRLTICINIFYKMDHEMRLKILNELYYSFARNNIKRVRINQETTDKNVLINEAISYADLYNGYEKNRKSKKWVRFKSLMNEINIEKANESNISDTIHEIHDTILQCKTRTDLHFRNSTLLLYAYTLQYELLTKNNLSLNKHQKQDKIKQLKKEISKVIFEIKTIDRQSDEEYEKSVKIAKQYFKNETSLLR